MMSSSAKAAAVFTLTFASLIPSQASAGISITSYLSAQEPVFTTSKPASKDDKPLTEVSMAEEDKSEEYKIGVMIKALSRAISSPSDTDSLRIITLYGTDSRYYVMIRGWLVQELSGVQSQLDANRNDKSKIILIERVEFLTQAIRHIDLE